MRTAAPLRGPSELLRGPSELLLSVSASAVLELLKTLDALLHRALSVDLVVAGAHVHRVAGLLLLSHHFDGQRAERKSIFLMDRRGRGGGDKEESERLLVLTQDEVVLCQLRVPDLFV